MKPTTLVFDFGGVMTTSNTPFRVRQIVEEKGLPWQAVLNGFKFSRLDYDIGDISVSEFYDRVWSEAGLKVPPEVRADIELADTTSFLYRNEETFAWYKSLHERGFRLGILTNMPRELAPHFKECFADFIALADTTVISSEVRLVKPMPEIYELVRANLGVESGEICFFDDSELNCKGATDAGWQAIRFTGVADASRQLEALLA